MDNKIVDEMKNDSFESQNAPQLRHLINGQAHQDAPANSLLARFKQLQMPTGEQFLAAYETVSHASQ